MPREIWRPIKGYEGLYEVSNFGRVMSLPNYNKRGGLLQPQHTDTGYLCVFMSKFGRVKQYFIHRLVASSFIPNPHNKPYVNHVYDTPLNNYVKNLEWATQKENIKHAVDTGLMSIGEDRYGAKLTNQQVIEIYNSKKKNKDIAKEYGVTPSRITAIKSGLKWSRITGAKRTKSKRLTEEKVLCIFKDRRPYKEIAAQYGIKENHVTNIKNGHIWSHVTGVTANWKTDKLK